MRINGHFICLNSNDPDRLFAFYHDIIGLKAKPELGPRELDLGGAGTLGIDGHSEIHGPDKEPARFILSLFVEDAKAERERLEALGVRFIRKEGIEYWGGIISTFIDPDGNYCQMVAMGQAPATS